jgi:uncharacterized membrane protein
MELVVSLVSGVALLCAWTAMQRARALGERLAALEAQPRGPAPLPWPSPHVHPALQPLPSPSPSPLSTLEPALTIAAAGARHPAELATHVAVALATAAATSPPPRLERAQPPAPPAAPRRSLEEIIGTRWTTWLGALAMFVAAALFLQLAMRRGWIGPLARVGLASAFGAVLLAAGHRQIRLDRRALGQGLLGAGLAVLHAAIVAGFAYSSLYPQALAFGLLVLVSILGFALAIRHDALPIAFLSLLGGFLAPVLVSTGSNSRDALFLYLAVLDLGVLAIAFYKRWRALDVLAFGGTWLLFSGWFARYYDASAAAPTLGWLVVFYAIFLGLPFAYHLRTRVPMTVERFVAALVNATAAFGYSQHILGHDAPALGLVSLAMAGAYLVLGALTRRRLPDDGRAIFGFVVLAMFFATLALPLHLRMHGLTVGWALEAPVLLVLGYRYRYFPVRVGALVALVLAVGRVVLLYTGSADGFSAPRLASGLAVPASAAACALLHHHFRAIRDRRDLPLQWLAAISGGYLLLAVLTAEISFGVDGEAAAAITALWTAGAVGFLAAGRHLDSDGVRRGAVVAAGVAVIAAVFVHGTVGLSILGPALLIAGHRYRDPAVRCAGLVASLFSVAALGPLYDDGAALADRLPQAVLVPVGLAVAALIHRRHRAAAGPREQHLALAFAIAAPVVALAIAHVELVRADLAEAPAAVILLWAAGSAGFLGAARRSRAGLATSAAAAALAGLLAVAAYADAEAPSATRLGAAVAVVAVLFALARRLRGGPDAALAAPALAIALIALWALLGAEIAVRVPAAAVGAALTVAWAVYALGLLAAGFARAVRWLRLAGLGLLGVAAGKLVLVDLVYRALSFLALGLVLTAASYAYHRFWQAPNEASGGGR